MGLFLRLAYKAISWVPRSETLAACCRYYCERCGDAPRPIEITSDFNTNGELRLLRELAPHLEMVFDVGANVGDWTRLMLSLRPTVRIHAFEPSTATYGQLASQKFPGTVTLHKVAFSSAAGTAPLYLFSDASVLNSLHNRHGLEDGYGRAPAIESEEVRLDTVDLFCTSNALQRVDLMKIDTEGHEVDVLLGSRIALAAGTVRRVQFEYGGTYIDARRLLKDVFDIFSGLDFALFLIVPDGLIACPRYDQRLENFRYNNFIALHSETIAHTPSALLALQQTR